VGGAPPEALIDALCALEVAIERRTTEVAAPVAALVAEASSAGVRVVAVSDMYFSSAELAAILAAHGLSDVARVYTSSDEGVSKFTGRLFSRLLALEGVRANEVVHLGDNLFADVLSARAHGIPAIWTTPRPNSGPAAVRRQSRRDPRVELGERLVGPALVTFAHLTLQRSRRDGIGELAFVARDGDLLMRVMERVIGAAPLLDRPRLRYVHLSRRSTVLSGAGALRWPEIADVLASRATNAGLQTIIAGLGLNPEPLMPLIACHTNDPLDRPIHHPSADPVLRAVLADPDVALEVARQAAAQRERLRRYLAQERLIRGGNPVGLVDVGWRGTIQSSLKAAFGGDGTYDVRRGYYLGLWPDAVPQAPQDLDEKWGALGDYRRGRSLHESAPWQLAFLFEAVCRASHGTVLGYRDEGGTALPVHARDGSPSRQRELLDEAAREPIRQGVLAFAESREARRIALAVVEARRARAVVQRKLLRAAFFPTSAELAAIGALHHTEGAAEHWSAPLLGPTQLRPWREPRAWLAGLSAPWRSGYVAATGGTSLAAAYALVEAGRVRMPTAVTRKVRETVSAVAKR
jgi:predicted HAD superfamily phosphohydrolase YqeG